MVTISSSSGASRPGERGLFLVPSAMVRLPADAVLIIPDQLFNLPATQARLVALAEQNRIPTMHLGRGPVEAGGLMAYAVANPALYRRAADYVVRILNGARPANLPIESPPEFELVLNLSAAQAIGFTFPRSILDRAGTVLP